VNVKTWGGSVGPSSMSRSPKLCPAGLTVSRVSMPVPVRSKLGSGSAFEFTVTVADFEPVVDGSKA
jgi:hypothetical protein